MTPMIPVNKIELAVLNGTSIVCATCTKFARAVEKRRVREDGSVECLAVDGCGSPIVGDTFHEYEGPITDFLRFCFVCGDPAQKGVAVKGHRRVIGACNKHVHYVVQMAPRTPSRFDTADRVVRSESGDSRVESLIPKETKTLGRALWEMEKGTFKPDG
jgi:hypothetical protein